MTVRERARVRERERERERKRSSSANGKKQNVEIGGGRNFRVEKEND